MFLQYSGIKIVDETETRAAFVRLLKNTAQKRRIFPNTAQIMTFGLFYSFIAFLWL